LSYPALSELYSSNPADLEVDEWISCSPVPFAINVSLELIDWAVFVK